MKNKILFYFMIFICVVVIIGTFFAVYRPPAQKSFKKFQEQIQKTVDPLTLQEWAISIVRSNQEPYEIKKNELPDFIRTFDKAETPEGFISEWNATGSSVVLLAWGGGFRSWGLIVGDKNYRGPKEDANDWVVPWAPGIYFYQGKH